MIWNQSVCRPFNSPSSRCWLGNPRTWLAFLLAITATVVSAIARSDSAGAESHRAEPATASSTKLRQVGKIDPPSVVEASAMAPSLHHPSYFWILCDSGNPPYLYLIEREGKVVARLNINGAINRDWEALASDGGGRLFIGDVGNNRTRFTPAGSPYRCVYRITEPQVRRPGAGPTERAEVEATHFYTFPEEPFDIEAMFLRDGGLYLIRKGKESNTKLYRLPLDRPGEFVQLIEIGPLPGVNTVTDAAISRDGRQLAVCSYDFAAKFTLDPAQPISQLCEQQPEVRRYSTRDIEGCTWRDDELLLVSEDGPIYVLRF